MRLKWLAYGGNSSTMNAYPYWTSRPTYEPPSAEFLLFPGIWLITVIQQHISWQTALWIYLKLCRCIHCETPSLINFWLNSDEFLPFLNSWHLIGQAVSTHFLINCSMDLFQTWLVHSLWDSPGLDNFLSCIPVIFRSDWLSSFHTFPDNLDSPQYWWVFWLVVLSTLQAFGYTQLNYHCFFVSDLSNSFCAF